MAAMWNVRRLRKSPLARTRAEAAEDAAEGLLAHMRKWRRELAHTHGIPAFMILHDTTLLDLCRKQPGDVSELLHVTGIGERKAVLYGAEILRALGGFHK